MMTQKQKKQHLSAVDSPYGEPTRLVRVPVSLIPEIEAFIRSGGGIPLFDQTIPAGFPSPAENYEYEGLNIVDYLIPHPEMAFLCKVTDRRLADRGIYPGDILVGRTDISPDTADLVVIESDGDYQILSYQDASTRTGTIRGVIQYALRKPLDSRIVFD